MGLSGKYNFQGLKKLGAAGFRVALASNPYTAWILKFGALTTMGLEFIANWCANNGLVILNVGADAFTGELNQHNFDAAMDKAMSEITIKGGRDSLTTEQKKAIDDEVIKVARKFIIIGNPKS